MISSISCSPCTGSTVSAKRPWNTICWSSFYFQENAQLFRMRYSKKEMCALYPSNQFSVREEYNLQFKAFRQDVGSSSRSLSSYRCFYHIDKRWDGINVVFYLLALILVRKIVFQSTLRKFHVLTYRERELFPKIHHHLLPAHRSQRFFFIFTIFSTLLTKINTRW